MTMLDWIIVAVYMLTAIGLGLVFARRASRNTSDFFAAGRSLPWWVAGTSLVATTFSADTPLFVAGLSRNEGIQGNWFWWAGAIGSTATIFFFAKLWRRTGVLTDVEFVAVRYDPSRARSALRIFKVFYDGFFFNAMVMATVTLACSKVIQVILGFTSEPVFTMVLWGTIETPVVVITQTGVAVFVLGSTALLYSILSGLYGVVYTDLIQFALAMVGSIWLAVVIFLDASKDGLLAQLQQSPGFSVNTLSFFPDLSRFDLITFTFLIYVSISWWAGAPGSGFIAQRLLATRSEKDSVLAFLWFCICHYVLRPWPWIIVGLMSLIYFPQLPGADAELAYPLMINHFLGPGIKGVMVASILAAYMSTLDTHLNCGASYLVNDFYQPFIRPNADARHYVRVSRIAMVVIIVVALLVSARFTGILDVYKYLAVVTGGIGSVVILRWYWWRVTVWSEILAMVSTLVIGNLCEFWLPDPVTVTGAKAADWFAYRLLISTLGTGLIWITFTCLTSTRPSPQSITFYRKTLPPGPGWKRIADEMGTDAKSDSIIHSMVGWLACLAFIYSLLIGIGSVLFSAWSTAAICTVVAVSTAWILIKCIREATVHDPPAS